MRVQVICEGNRTEIAEQLREAADVYAAPSAAPVATAEAPKPAKEKKAKPAAEPAPAPAEDEEEEFDLGDQEAEETEEEEVEEEPAATLEDVIGAFQKYAKKHSREKAAKVLAAFKVKSVRDLKPTQFGEVLAKLG